MADLLPQLQAGLGDRYRIERELGGGGMSRVFLAEETALGRRVVVKVLSPELAAAVSAERFEREVRVAAGLQHPHVVPLLAAGRVGELLYYTMPYVEGESLRARLDRQGELPVEEAVRLLREVAGALAHAHAQGLVHRDIKPDNVLLSHGHAVLTDFGIARALGDAGGETRMTATGVAIGTPGYMAPEQAAGEAHTDHRADLYALGAVAYEMLSGEPPFRAATAQALVAAHLTRRATPVEELRGAVPPGLAAIVHRCLEKRPADRYQSSTEVVAAIDALGTGYALATPAPHPVDGGAHGVSGRAWPMTTVLPGYAAAAAGLLAGAWALRTLAGLPDWFFAAAAVLVALGLPSVALAVALHNRRVLQPARTPLPLPRVLHRRLTPRTALLGGAAAFAALGLITVTYSAMRAFGIGPVGTLIAAGLLEERERLVIADFANRTRDALLGPAVTEAFRVDFSQSRLVTPVSDDYLRRVLQRMGRPDDSDLEADVALEVAQREGIRVVVAGELTQAGPSVIVSARLLDAASGDVLATARETARDSTRIVQAVDRVSKRLRERIGESLRGLRAGATLEDVTTRSLEALRLYSQAVRAGTVGDEEREIALLEAAVAQDSAFAMAWRTLGIKLGNTGRNASRAEFALRRAFELREHLTVRERRLTEAAYYTDVRARADSATAALEALLVEYPDDTWALNNLGVLYFTQGRLDRAEALTRRTVELDPGEYIQWGNLIQITVGLGRLDAAAEALDGMRAHVPPGIAVDIWDAYLALAGRDFELAELRIRELLAGAGTNDAARLRLGRLLAGVLAVRGRMADADRALLESSRLHAERGLSGEALLEELRRAWVVAELRGDGAAASARFEATLRETPLEDFAPRDRPLVQLTLLAAAIGDRERAEGFLREFEEGGGSEPGRVRTYLGNYISGEVLALREETLPRAVEAFHRAGSGPCATCAPKALGRVFDAMAMPDSALAYYERWAEVGEGIWTGPGFYDITQAPTYFRMGELYQARGDGGRAAAAYARAAEIWRDADAELQPMVREARRRAADPGGEAPS